MKKEKAIKFHLVTYCGDVSWCYVQEIPLSLNACIVKVTQRQVNMQRNESVGL